MSQSIDNTPYSFILSFDTFSQLHTSGWQLIICPEVRQELIQILNKYRGDFKIQAIAIDHHHVNRRGANNPRQSRHFQSNNTRKLPRAYPYWKLQSYR